MKAFIISLDALISVSIMFLMLVLMFGQDFHPAAPRGVYLKQLSQDALAILEKSGRLGRMADGNNTAVREIFDAAPQSVCMQLLLEDDAGNPVSTALRPDCYSAGKETQSLAAAFAHGGRLYVVRLESWYREVPS